MSGTSSKVRAAIHSVGMVLQELEELALAHAALHPLVRRLSEGTSKLQGHEE